MHTLRHMQFAAVLATLCTSSAQALDFFGPTSYLSAADTPNGFVSGTMAVEDCEDGSVDPRLLVSAQIIGPGGLTDSVDADDGAIDGSGTNGRSLFGAPPLEVQFFPPLPTSAGLVWTDGGFGTSVTFEAFRPDGLSLGSIGPFTLGDSSNQGDTDEDRFFGVRDDGGILRLRITHTSGGIEIDHIQFNDYDNIFANGFDPMMLSIAAEYVAAAR